MPQKTEMMGKRFGKLTVIAEGSSDKNGIKWICKCDCGNITKEIYGNALRNGATKSCGCLQKEIVSQVHSKHGQCTTKLYKVWQQIKRRCLAKSDAAYKYYGNRGITICEEWKDNFETFRDHVSKLPHFGEEGYTLDRIDNNRDYKPDNVRWATKKEQANNTRRNFFIEIEGMQKTLSQWSEQSGVPCTTILYRYRRGLRGADLIKKRK